MTVIARRITPPDYIRLSIIFFFFLNFNNKKNIWKTCIVCSCACFLKPKQWNPLDSIDTYSRGLCSLSFKPGLNYFARADRIRLDYNIIDTQFLNNLLSEGHEVRQLTKNGKFSSSSHFTMK